MSTEPIRLGRERARRGPLIGSMRLEFRLDQGTDPPTVHLFAVVAPVASEEDHARLVGYAPTLLHSLASALRQRWARREASP